MLPALALGERVRARQGWNVTARELAELADRVRELRAWARARIAQCVQMERSDPTHARERRSLEIVLRKLDGIPGEPAQPTSTPTATVMAEPGDVCTCGRPRATAADLERWNHQTPGERAEGDRWAKSLCWTAEPPCPMKPIAVSP